MALAVIPARYGSTRFPGKVLHPILGKPMVQHVWERVKEAGVFQRVIIASDSDVVIRRCRQFGADVRRTAIEHSSGTSRVAEVASDLDYKIVVNIQADEPLISPPLLDLLVRRLNGTHWASVSTPIVPIRDTNRLTDHNVVKLVLNRRYEILYFSRAAIPGGFKSVPIPGQTWEHQGVYACRRDAIIAWSQAKPSALEQVEDLEQLRFFYLDMKILGVPSTYISPGVNTPEDVPRVEKIMKENRS